jgi:hypothetical protein
LRLATLELAPALEQAFMNLTQTVQPLPNPIPVVKQGLA